MLGGIAHSGTSRGVISTPDGLAHPIYFVAVPKNDAISMLLGGNIGFQVAGGAEATERGIVLSAGRDIAFGSLNAGGARSAGAGTGSVSVSGLPSLTAGTLIQAGVPLDIAGNVQIETNGAPVTIDAGSDISFTGTVSIDTSASFNLTGPTQAGNISLLAGEAESTSAATSPSWRTGMGSKRSAARAARSPSPRAGRSARYPSMAA
ncbi:hypothetical protein ACFSTI_07585 [Rhizorhabdus histidinilytica]